MHSVEKSRYTGQSGTAGDLDSDVGEAPKF